MIINNLEDHIKQYPHLNEEEKEELMRQFTYEIKMLYAKGDEKSQERVLEVLSLRQQAERLLAEVTQLKQQKDEAA